MKNYRLFLLSFITVSLVALTGFTGAGVNHSSSAKKTAASVQIKKVHANVKQSTVNATQKKAKKQRLILNAKNSTIAAVKPQKTLDLSIPFNDAGNAWVKLEQNRMAQVEASNMFAVGKKKKARSVDLDGQMLMSQEPEVDKRKSLDGAAIVINLKR